MNANWNDFGGTCQRSKEWLDAVAASFGGDRQCAWHALRGVLHALRDRLPLAETTDFAAQLPMLIRGLYYEGFTLRNAQQRYRSRDEFLARVTDAMRTGPNRSLGIPAEDACRAVFPVLVKHVTHGEMRHVIDALPGEVQELWPAPELA